MTESKLRKTPCPSCDCELDRFVYAHLEEFVTSIPADLVSPGLERDILQHLETYILDSYTGEEE